MRKEEARRILRAYRSKVKIPVNKVDSLVNARLILGNKQQAGVELVSVLAGLTLITAKARLTVCYHANI